MWVCLGILCGRIAACRLRQDFIPVFQFFYPIPTPLTQNEIDDSIAQVLASTTPTPAYSAQVYQAILPSLVIIQTQNENPDEEDRVGIGSDVVINTNADILTAFHVVSDAAAFVTFARVA